MLITCYLGSSRQTNLRILSGLIDIKTNKGWSEKLISLFKYSKKQENLKISLLVCSGYQNYEIKVFLLSDDESEGKRYNLLARWIQHQFNPSMIWLNFRFNWFECEPNGTGALWPFYYDEKIFSEINLQSIYFPFISYFLWQQNCGECWTQWKLSLWLPYLNDLRKQDWELSEDYMKVLLILVENFEI